MIFVFFVVMWYLSLFSQSFFHHRYASHRAFKMSKFWERFFFIFSYFTQGPHFLSPKAYAIMHRMHHAHTDTQLDPHSPKFSSNIFSMMWRTRNRYKQIYMGKELVEEKYLANLPEWKAFERVTCSTVSRIIWIAFYLLIFIWLTTAWWQFLLLPVLIVLGAFHGAIINWFAHKYGYRNHRLNNTARNLFRVDFLMLGEAYHNNHHKYPSSANFGYKGREIDPLYPVILLLHKLRVVRLAKSTDG
jgi:stearoyl-CoA desaturase (delta-9 desaturase)